MDDTKTERGSSAHAHPLSAVGLLVTLGIIYGDIGTSPLYVMKSVIGERAITERLVFGGISCVFWTLTIQTTFKYILLTLRADNRGEGGIFSLYALVRRYAKPAKGAKRLCLILKTTGVIRIKNSTALVRHLRHPEPKRRILPQQEPVIGWR